MSSISKIQTLHRGLLLLCLTVLMVMAGCATTGDLQRVRGQVDQRLGTLEDKVNSLDQKIQAISAEHAEIRKEIAKNSEAMGALQKRQADTGTEITEIKDQIQHLQGIVDGLRKDIATGSRKDEELKERLDAAVFKINFIENYLGIGKKEDAHEGAEKNGKQSAGPKNSTKGKTDKESVYATAYATFKEGKYEKARTEFQNFLKQFPNTELSDNAQFWIGESFYYENKFEKAILEYEKVVKNYPDGDKVSAALLKQGFCFLKLGDKASAKLILQQVIKDYPNTNQSRIARSKLSEIK